MRNVLYDQRMIRPVRLRNGAHTFPTEIGTSVGVDLYDVLIVHSLPYIVAEHKIINFLVQ
jgi:hypothetical protein